MELRDELARFVRATGPEHTPLQERMAEFAAEESFPIIGPDAGGVLRLLARLTGAGDVFEFGSGFGYSASWFLRGGADRVVLTEVDADELEQGRTFLGEAGLADRCAFEGGDAMETIERYDGPFDVALIDHQKSRYADAFRAVKPKLSDGAVVVADNVTRGPIDFDALLAHFESGEPLPADDDFETTVLPLGSGIAVSVHVA